MGDDSLTSRYTSYTASVATQPPSTPPGSHLPDIFADFPVDQRVELGVHRFERRAILSRIEREIVALERILLDVEKLYGSRRTIGVQP